MDLVFFLRPPGGSHVLCGGLNHVLVFIYVIFLGPEDEGGSQRVFSKSFSDNNGTASSSTSFIPIFSVYSNDGLVSSGSAIVALLTDEIMGAIFHSDAMLYIYCDFKPKQKPRTPAGPAVEDRSENRKLAITSEDLIEST